MDELVEMYADAVRTRAALKMLPPGVREYALDFEKVCLDDIRAATGNPALTEEEALAMAPSGLKKVIQAIMPIAIELAGDLIKKHYPAAATSSLLSAIATYLVLATK